MNIKDSDIEQVRKVLARPMKIYKDLLVQEFNNEIDSSYIYDEMVGIFADNITRGDCLKLMEIITPEFCKICLASPMTANCNNANCQYEVSDYA